MSSAKNLCLADVAKGNKLRIRLGLRLAHLATGTETLPAGSLAVHHTGAGFSACSVGPSPRSRLLGLTARGSLGYYVVGRARRGASGALNPQSATAGLNSCSRSRHRRGYSRQVAMIIWPCAARRYEPRQVRKEAAVSGGFERRRQTGLEPAGRGQACGPGRQRVHGPSGSPRNHPFRGVPQAGVDRAARASGRVGFHGGEYWR